MQKHNNDQENAEIQRTVSQSELIEPLGFGVKQDYLILTDKLNSSE